MRILVLGAGVIGSVYGAALLQAGHDVAVLARGSRLADLRSVGLVLEEAVSGQRRVLRMPVVSEPPADALYDVVLVPVRAEQLASTLPLLTGMRDGFDVLFFGNTAGRQGELTAALGRRALFGFPAAGGMRDGAVVRYALIRQQKTMLGEPDGTTTPRARRLQEVLSGAGLPTRISADIDGWLLGHAAFVVPMAFALYRVGVDPAALAADHALLRLMVLATREAFAALRSVGNAEIPTNLAVLYQRLPAPFAVAYWRRVLASQRGELWFGAHTRAAPAEMQVLAGELRAALRRTGRATPYLERLIDTPT